MPKTSFLFTVRVVTCPATLTGTRRTYNLRLSTAHSLRMTRRRSNAEAMGETRARESREEGETRRRANADAMREVRARRIADSSGSTVVHAPTYTQK